MFDRTWEGTAQDPARAAALAASAGVGPLTAAVLLARGVDTSERVRRFLTPALEDLSDPSTILGMSKAAERLARAVRARERIWICGDYDVDGTSGTSILVHFFRRLGIEARVHVPHRVKEGYGLKPEAVDQIAEAGADLAITVDNGISAPEAARRARELGIDLVITDHHEPPEVLPECLALVNPHQPGCPSTYKELCGAGLAFKLAWATSQVLGAGGRATPEMREFLLEALGLVALATVADAAPLDGENRVLVRYGVRALSQTRLPGVRALLARAGVEGVPTARDLAFGLGPRINAGGRLAHADLSIRLLTTQDPAEAERLADELERLNRDRREVERAVLEDALGRVPDPAPPVLVLGDEAWHLGVLGIVASKLAERLHRPALLVAWDAATGKGKGSGRSIPGFHLTEALASCREHLEAYGGHAYASGFSLRRESLAPLGEALSRLITAWAGGAVPRPVVHLDAEVRLEDLREASVRELSHLAPHGEGNPPPVLWARGLTLSGTPSRMGRDGAHLSFLARQGAGRALRVVAFKQGALLERVQREAAGGFDLAFTPGINTWRGASSVELEAVAVRAPSCG